VVVVLVEAIGGDDAVAGLIVSVRWVVVVVVMGGGLSQPDTSRAPPSRAMLPAAFRVFLSIV
jgi:hypothetical protein